MSKSHSWVTADQPYIWPNLSKVVACVHKARITELHSIRVLYLCKGPLSNYICTKVNFSHARICWAERKRFHSLFYFYLFKCPECPELMPGIFSGPVKNKAVGRFFFITQCQVWDNTMTSPECACLHGNCGNCKPGNERKIFMLFNFS